MPRKYQDDLSPRAHITVSWDGTQISVSSLNGEDPRDSWLTGKPKEVAGIKIRWGGIAGFGKLASVGKKKINYSLFGWGSEVTSVTGNDPRVIVFVQERPRPEREDRRQRPQQEQKEDKSFISRLFS